MNSRPRHCYFAAVQNGQSGVTKLLDCLDPPSREKVDQCVRKVLKVSQAQMKSRSGAPNMPRPVSAEVELLFEFIQKETNMAKTKKIVDEDFGLVGELEQAASPTTQYVVLTGGDVEGECDTMSRTYLVSRSLLEASGIVYDADGRESWLPEPRPESTDPEAKSTLKRLRRILREARERGVEFICCYHVEGDAGWYMACSDDYDKWSAMEPMLLAIFRDSLADSDS